MSRRLYFVTFLTFVRVPLVLFFGIGAVLYSTCWASYGWLLYASLGCLVAAAVTDLLDGYFARKLKATSTLGAYADPFTDKVFYLTALPVLVFLAAKNGHVTHAVILLCFAITFLLRDQWVSFLRSLGSLHDASARANWSGKLRTSISFPLICLVYWVEASGTGFVGLGLLYALEALGFVVNLISIWVYTRAYWQYLRRAATRD